MYNCYFILHDKSSILTHVNAMSKSLKQLPNLTVDRCLIVACSFVLFRLAIVFSVLLRYTDYDYPLGIVKLFSQVQGIVVLVVFKDVTFIVTINSAIVNID